MISKIGFNQSFQGNRQIVKTTKTGFDSDEENCIIWDALKTLKNNKVKYQMQTNKLNNDSSVDYYISNSYGNDVNAKLELFCDNKPSSNLDKINRIRITKENAYNDDMSKETTTEDIYKSQGNNFAFTKLLDYFT